MNREIFNRLEQGSAARAANLMSAREVYRSRAITAEPISLAAESRRGFNPLTKLALLLTALAAPAFALLHDARPVSADELTKPSVYIGADGNEFTVATFRKPGRAYIFTSKTGLRVADGSDASGGVVYGGKEAKVVIVANSADMNARITALKCGGLYIDVIDDVGGDGYMEKAPNAMAVLEQEMDRVPVQDRAESSKVGIIIGKNDDLNQYFDEIGGSEKSNIGLESQGCSVPAEVPVLPAPVESCVNLEVPLGTASGNGATVNEVTVTRDVIAHGDLIINDEFRADDNGATGLIERVHASLANPARIRVANPAWGGDVAAFCIPADMAANVDQGVANLQSRGMRADVLDWPGPKQQ